MTRTTTTTTITVIMLAAAAALAGCGKGHTIIAGGEPNDADANAAAANGPESTVCADTCANIASRTFSTIYAENC